MDLNEMKSSFLLLQFILNEKTRNAFGTKMFVERANNWSGFIDPFHRTGLYRPGRTFWRINVVVSFPPNISIDFRILFFSAMTSIMDFWTFLRPSIIVAIDFKICCKLFARYNSYCSNPSRTGVGRWCCQYGWKRTSIRSSGWPHIVACRLSRLFWYAFSAWANSREVSIAIKLESCDILCQLEAISKFCFVFLKLIDKLMIVCLDRM